MFRWAWPRLRRVVRQREPPHNRLSPDQPSPEKTDRAVWAAFALYSDRLRGQAPVFTWDGGNASGVFACVAASLCAPQDSRVVCAQEIIFSTVDLRLTAPANVNGRSPFGCAGLLRYPDDTRLLVRRDRHFANLLC